MTKGEVADFLEKCRWWFEPYTSEKEKWNEALDMAIKALQNLSKPNNGLQGSDLISRQDAIKNAHFPVIDDASYEVVRVDDILALQSADRPTGEWVLKESEDGVYWWHECSKCGEKPLLDRWMHDEKLSDFCWNCGSKMFKGGEKE